ncbi:MAG: protein phosphatase 2C domain-containing protein [Dehalococcoidia bacterium]|jgi:hypothetical protein
MKPKIQEFGAAKAGNKPEEYEDALSFDPDRGLFAIADGATEASYAKEWANLLVEAFVADPSCLKPKTRVWSSNSLFLEWLKPLQKTWHESINWSVLPWFAEAKAKAGAFASFVGLEIGGATSLGNTGRWRALAIGDCVLLQVRDDSLKLAFPLAHSDEFGRRPIQVSSNPATDQIVKDAIKIKNGNWRIGDVFFLCSDALGKWFLNQCENGAKPWLVIGKLETKEEFESLIAKLLTENLVNNDDMTLITIHIEAA